MIKLTKTKLGNDIVQSTRNVQDKIFNKSGKLVRSDGLADHELRRSGSGAIDLFSGGVDGCSDAVQLVAD